MLDAGTDFSLVPSALLSRCAATVATNRDRHVGEPGDRLGGDDRLDEGQRVGACP